MQSNKRVKDELWGLFRSGGMLGCRLIFGSQIRASSARVAVLISGSHLG